MPELPEVETTRLSLLPVIKGQKILRVELKRDTLRFPLPKDFAKRLAGRTIKAIRRRAKYLLFDLDDGGVILAHLGMSGSFLVTSQATHTPRKHDHVLFHMENGEVMIFHDPRRFGLFDLLKKGEEHTHPLLYKLGPEPLGKDFSPAYLKQVLARRSTAIKPALMDQHLVVGVGNIYASESLFLCKLHPATPANETLEHAAAMIAAIRKSLNAALKSGGSTLRNFSNGLGFNGHFQHEFNVYGRQGQPCVVCGTEIEEMVQAARTTFFCPHCQKQKSTRKIKSRKKAKK